jgi:hypothetical protein
MRANYQMKRWLVLPVLVPVFLGLVAVAAAMSQW